METETETAVVRLSPWLRYVPREIWLMIFRLLSAKDLYVLLTVCKTWREFVMDGILWQKIKITSETVQQLNLISQKFGNFVQEITFESRLSLIERPLAYEPILQWGFEAQILPPAQVLHNPTVGPQTSRGHFPEEYLGVSERIDWSRTAYAPTHQKSAFILKLLRSCENLRVLNFRDVVGSGFFEVYFQNLVSLSFRTSHLRFSHGNFPSDNFPFLEYLSIQDAVITQPFRIFHRNLKTLLLKNCEFFLETLSAPNLEIFDLSSTSALRAGVGRIESCFVKELNFSRRIDHHGFSRDSISSLSPLSVLYQSPLLQKLSCDYTSEISNFSQISSSLKYLSYASARSSLLLGDHDLDRFPFLEVVHLDHWNVVARNLRIFHKKLTTFRARSLQADSLTLECESLESLDVQQSSLLRLYVAPCQLTHLDIMGTPLLEISISGRKLDLVSLHLTHAKTFLNFPEQEKFAFTLAAPITAELHFPNLVSLELYANETSFFALSSSDLVILSQGCPNLKKLRVTARSSRELYFSFPCLTHLSIFQSTDLEELLIECAELVVFDFQEAPSLMSCQMTCSLAAVDFGRCSRLRRFMISSIFLESLDLRGCVELESLSVHTPVLISLCGDYCRSLTHLQTHSQILSLERLNLPMCKSLMPETLHAFLNASTCRLTRLDLSYCSQFSGEEIEKILRTCGDLVSLTVSNCNLSDNSFLLWPPFAHPLADLDISCNSVSDERVIDIIREHFPVLSKLNVSSLEFSTLNVRFFPALTALKAFGGNLSEILIESCFSLQEIQVRSSQRLLLCRFVNLTSLDSINLSGCPALREIQIFNCGCLSKLNVSFCTSLTTRSLCEIFKTSPPPPITLIDLNGCTNVAVTALLTTHARYCPGSLSVNTSASPWSPRLSPKK
eukprot:TRINITY_DN3003_c0_g1_i1.p1 TRINITY_DN3003_c0_g1~~TRINITY_DN3003_c0_g1_i1.p1  ORF type:complete len:936 (-),score=197.52 TRINITY_DN3003_c0_g1_i1:21-2720(-)